MCFDSLPLIFLFNEILLAHHWMRIYDKLLSWTMYNWQIVVVFLVYLLEHKTRDILAAERLRLMR